MDLLKAYGSAKKVVAVAAQVDTAVSLEERGRFAVSSRGLALPAPRKRDREEEAKEEEKQQDKKQENKQDEEDKEEEEEEEEKDLFSRLPDLPEESDSVKMFPRVAPQNHQHNYPAAAPSAPSNNYYVAGPSKPSTGYVRYAEVDDAWQQQAMAEEEEQRGPVIKEISQAALMKDQARIQQELHHEIAAPPSSRSTSFGGRRKHQLSR